MYKLTYTGSANSRYGIYQDFTLEPNQDYTLSGELAGPGSQVGWAMVANLGWPSAITSIGSNDTKVSFKKTLTTTSTNYKCRVYLAIGTTGTNKYSWFNIPKLEKGNKATAWSPAPEDATNYTDTLVNNIEIGGRNILRGTQTMTAGGGNWSTGTFRASGGTLSNVAITDAPIPNITQAIKLDSSTNATPGFAQDYYKMQGHVGDTLVYSGWFKGVSGDSVKLQAYYTSASGEAEQETAA